VAATRVATSLAFGPAIGATLGRLQALIRIAIIIKMAKLAALAFIP
jgi:hypothetical protein